MSADGSVTRWLGRMLEGDPDGVQQLWERYFQSLVGMARKKLHGRRPAVADEEDVALSAFHSFCRAAGQKKFPRLSDRNDLWQVLVVLTARKAFRLLRYEDAEKRGGDGRPTPADNAGNTVLPRNLASVTPWAWKTC